MLWPTLSVRQTCEPKRRSSPSLGAPSSRKSEAHAQRTTVHLCSRNAPLRRRPWVGRVFSVRFPGGRNMPWARKGPGPCRAGRSPRLPNAGQFSRAFCPNRSGFGKNALEKSPENARRNHLGCRMYFGPHPWGLAGQVSARAHSTPIDIHETDSGEDNACGCLVCGGPTVAVYSGQDISQSLGSNARSLLQSSASGVLFLVASISRTRSPTAMHVPTTLAPWLLPALQTTLGRR